MNMWRFREVVAGVGEFHAMGHPEGREVWLHCWNENKIDNQQSVLVLGSSQRMDTAKTEVLKERDIALVKRQSGGGAVLVEFKSLMWIDVFIPRDDAFWEDDVGKSSIWLGEVWVKTLAEFGAAAEVHKTPYEPGNWGKLVCFAGRAPGEVFLEGRKSIGISQRRTKQGARFQTALVRRWNITELSPLLNLSDKDRIRLETETAAAAYPLPLPPSEVFSAFCSIIQKTQ